jgi:hypothetical protein
VYYEAFDEDSQLLPYTEVTYQWTDGGDTEETSSYNTRIWKIDAPSEGETAYYDEFGVHQVDERKSVIYDAPNTTYNHAIDAIRKALPSAEFITALEEFVTYAVYCSKAFAKVVWEEKTVWQWGFFKNIKKLIHEPLYVGNDWSKYDDLVAFHVGMLNDRYGAGQVFMTGKYE